MSVLQSCDLNSLRCLQWGSHHPDPPLSVSDAVEGGDGGKKRRACRIYVEPTVSTSSPAVRCCGRITPAPCAPCACHNSGEPCRILVEGCCALLLGGPPAPLPRLILVKPCLFLVDPCPFLVATCCNSLPLPFLQGW